MDATCRTAKEALLGLGNTADEIAAALEARNVRGVPSDSYDCAYRTYLGRVLGGKFSSPPAVSVDGDCIDVGGCKLRSRDRLSKVLAEQLAEARGLSATDVTYEEAMAAASPDDLDHLLPDHIWDFVERFDDEKYPKLVTARTCCTHCGDSMLECDAVTSSAVEGDFCSSYCADRAWEEDLDDDLEEELLEEEYELLAELDDPEFDDEGEDEEDEDDDDGEEDLEGEWEDRGEPVG